MLLLLSNSNGRGGGDFYIHPADYANPTDQEKEDQKLIDRVSGRWAGDVLVVQGDYAKETDQGFIKDSNEYSDISTTIFDAMLILASEDESSDIVQTLERELEFKTKFDEDISLNVRKDSNGRYHSLPNSVKFITDLAKESKSKTKKKTKKKAGKK